MPVIVNPVDASMARYNGAGGYLNVCELEFWGKAAEPALIAALLIR